MRTCTASVTSWVLASASMSHSNDSYELTQAEAGSAARRSPK